MKSASKLVCFLAGLSVIAIDRVEAGFVVQPNDVATTALLATAGPFTYDIYSDLPLLVTLPRNAVGATADLDGGVTGTSIAVSRFNGAASTSPVGPIGTLTVSAVWEATAAAQVSVAPGSDEGYYIQDRFSISGHVAPDDAFTIRGAFMVTDGNNVTYYLSNFVMPTSLLPGDFSLDFVDPFHNFANFRGDHVANLRVSAFFGFFGIEHSSESTHLNFNSSIVVTTGPAVVPEPSSVVLLSVSFAVVSGFLGVRSRRRARSVAA